MPYSMMAYGYAGSPILGALHGLFCVITLIGAILFLIWAYKFLKEPRLRELVIIFLSVGLVGLFLSAALGGTMMKRGFNENNVKFRMMDGTLPGGMWEIRESTIEPGEEI